MRRQKPGCSALALAASCLLAGPAAGLPSTPARLPGHYPKLLAYSSPINTLPPAQLDTLSLYNVVVCMDRSESLTLLRLLNPNQKYLWQIEPQLADSAQGDDPWWLPDTLWNVKRLQTYYVYKNNWYLRDTHGQPINDGHHFAVNWTQYCPVGTFGSAKGLRASQWMASVALPEMALTDRFWPTWSWDSRTSYNGYMFEILADCMGSYGWQIFADADVDQNGTAEGVYHTCSMGGADDTLSVLFRQENEDFYQRLSAAFPPEFVFTINENSKYIGPWWRTKLSGMKLENWMRGCCPPWATWWDYFYGIRAPDDPTNSWGEGYEWAEENFDKPVADSLKGWDLSYIVTWNDPGKPPSENLRQMRFGLGTTMLGDGYFAYSLNDYWPQWRPEFDWDFGAPLADFTKEVYGADTVYVRTFANGMVEVNPNADVTNGVPSQDTRFTFWLPIHDLAVSTQWNSTTIQAAWTAPHGQHNDSDSFDLRYATFPLTNANWDSATAYSGDPVVAPAGQPVSVTVTGLDPATAYYFAIRSTTRGHPEPNLSNVAPGRTRDPNDHIPPARIGGLATVLAHPTWADLTWIATGDDSTTGTASLYLLRYLPGDTINSETRWSLATPADSLPLPSPPGTQESYRLTGLQPMHTYAVAVRAQDDGMNLSALPLPFFVHTPDPAGVTEPAVVTDLAGSAIGAGAVRLTWRAVAGDEAGRPALGYEVRLLAGRRIESEADWAAASAAPDPPPEPAAPGTRMAMDARCPGGAASYGVAVRPRDRSGRLAGLSNPLLVPVGAGPGPASLTLEGPFPHPVRASCRFRVRVPPGLGVARIVLRIEDAQGREIRRIYDGAAPGPGALDVVWDRRDGSGRPAAPGFYLATLDAGGRAVHRRIFVAP